MSPAAANSDSASPPPASDAVNPFTTGEELQDKVCPVLYIKEEEEGHNAKGMEQQQHESQPTVNVVDNFLSEVSKSTSDSNWTEKKPVMVANRNQQMNRRKVDFIDLMDPMGGLLHHESPYDCALPHRNVNSEAPVLAFSQADDIFHPSARDQNLDDKYSSNRTTPYNVNYRDSFLEGSAAYGLQAPRNPEKAKRNSIFRRTFNFMSLQRKNNNS